jgi:TolB-like protein/Flp pilus assembly protein TadD/DNA-binding winged helix-turn-helix (wHTH) protein
MRQSTAVPFGPESTGYQIDDLIIDMGRLRVMRAGAEIPLSPLSFDLLAALAAAAPNPLSFDQLIERVWPGLVVSQETVSQRVKLVRDALGDDPHAPRYIAGVRGRGYRMLAAVTPLGVNPPTPPHTVQSAAAEPDSSPHNDTNVSSRRRAGTIVGTCALLLILIGAFVASYLRAPMVATRTTAGSASSVVVQAPKTIAVLPLIDISPGGGNEYLGDGLAQELSSRLARVPGLRIASRTSAFVFKGRSTDVRTIAQILGVRHVLEGSVRREGTRLRVTAQLIDASTGFHVWSQTYDRTWQDLLTIEDDLARAIVDALRVVLSGDIAQRFNQPPTTHVEAFDLYLGGLAKLRQPASAAQLEEAESMFNEALVTDPRFALAYAGLCECYTIGYDRTRDTALATKAEAACRQALVRDASLFDVETALANLYVTSGQNEEAAVIFRGAVRRDPSNADAYIGLARAYEGQHRTLEAENTYRRAIDADPGYWAAYSAWGNFLFQHGRGASAVAQYRHVTELVPASASGFNNLGASLEMIGDFPGAARAFEQSLALEPTRSAYSNTGTMYYFLGRFPDAVRMFRKAAELASEDHRMWGNLADALYQTPASRQEAESGYRHAIQLAERQLKINPKEAVDWAQLAYYYARVGDFVHARQFAARALELGTDLVFVHYYVALIAIAGGDEPAALESLRHAVDLGFPGLLVRAAPEFESLHRDERFRQLLATTSQPPAQ